MLCVHSVSGTVPGLWEYPRSSKWGRQVAFWAPKLVGQRLGVKHWNHVISFSPEGIPSCTSNLHLASWNACKDCGRSHMSSSWCLVLENQKLLILLLFLLQLRKLRHREVKWFSKAYCLWTRRPPVIGSKTLLHPLATCLSQKPSWEALF